MRQKRQVSQVMSSKFDASYLDAGSSRNMYKKAEQNVYFSSERIGEYCGIEAPTSSGTRSSELAFPSGSGFNDRRARIDESAPVNNDHIRTNHSVYPSNQNTRIPTEALGRNNHIRTNNADNSANQNKWNPNDQRGRNNHIRTYTDNQSNHNVHETHDLRERNDHIRRNNRGSYDGRLAEERENSHGAPRMFNDRSRCHIDSAQSTVSFQTQPKPQNIPRLQRHSTGNNPHHSVIIAQPKARLPTPARDSCLNTGGPVVYTTSERIDSNMNKVKGKHLVIRPPDNRPPDNHIESRHALPEQGAPPRNPRVRQIRREEVRNPMLGDSHRPHSLDVPDKKVKVQRTASAPELRQTTSCRELQCDERKQKCISNGHQIHNEHVPLHQKDKYSKHNSHMKGLRSKSLPTVVIPRTKRNTDANPLRYFAYLGKRFQFRERLLSAHNVLSSRPVILTSTSVISPEVINNFRNQLDDYDEPYETPKNQSACQDLIDCCTCMCCVKALFYHCTKDDESEGELSEHPCSCSRPGASCLLRWGILGMLSVCMPCLLCYLPIQGCKCAVEYFRRKETTDSQ